MLSIFARAFLSTAGIAAIAAAFRVAPTTVPTPRSTLDSLEVTEGLTATLVAEAPTLTNPTNIDVDARGRIWVLEGVNYRKFKPKPLRAAGDRIVILEDTNGDGVADKSKVFYQGTDIDAAMGIAVLGKKIYVSAYKNIFVFTDTDGDDKPDKKEVLFTSVTADHDHSVHAFVFGPDGRLYFNGGNETRALMDPAGNVLVDKAGNRIEQKNTPYQEGMVFRLEPNGTNLEVLGYDFRNPYEVAVDPFGTVWQSDNDDDGNRSTRLNYVMEGGSFGYRDEMTGAGWRTRRVGMSTDIPRQHWHSDDPGSVPNVRINGAGAPSGIAIYEGTLLPRRFWGTVLHADAGVGEVRAFPVRTDGAGYAADYISIVRAPRDRMFRPVDVATAPDGSLIIADWYDAGVGGHDMSDQAQGRIIRLAPPGARYRVPKLDLSRPAGAANALRSPNHATRFLAYEQLHKMGKRAEAVLTAMYNGANQFDRARALWLLAQLPKGAHHLEIASRDGNPDIRIVAIRATERIGADVIPIAVRLVRDPSPAVRREVALALRHNRSPRAAALWAELARQYDGRDRWYLEALGISADRQWDRYFGAWLERTREPWGSQAGRDIVWRSRSASALPLLERFASDGWIPNADKLRYFRALDFHSAEGRQRSLLAILGTPSGASAELTPVILSQLDAKSTRMLPAVQLALVRTLGATHGTAQFVELVDKYDARDQLDELIRLAIAKPNETAGADAARLALSWGAAPQFSTLVLGADETIARRALSVLGRNFTPQVDSLVVGVVLDTARSPGLRRWAVQTMGNGQGATQRLLRLVQAGALPDDLKPAAASVLFSANSAIRDSAAKYLTPPPATTSDGKTLPPLLTLAARSGDAVTGRAVFQRTCTACHVAQDLGINFGPALTEIGDKLPKSGLYMAILDPSAGIAFGYEGYDIKTRDSLQVTGYITSETADEVVLKMVGGIERRVPKSTIIGRRRMEGSLMPHGLERTMTEEELVHLVEYLSTLRRPR